MSALIRLDSKGLVLAPGELSRAPGALVQADNVNVEAPGVIRSRNGFAKQTNGVGGPGWKFITTKELGSNLLFNHGSSTSAGGLKYGDGSAAWTTIAGTVTNQPATRMQAAISRRNHYLTSDEGVRRLETDYSLAYAGMPKGLALDLTGPAAILSGAPGFVIADTESVAYRVTWLKKDQQLIPMEGAPSSRTVVYNNTRTTGWAAGVSKNVTCRILLPKQAMTASTNLTTSYYYRLWRSKAAAVGISPSDDMNLVAEGFLVAGDITNGYVDVTDSTPEAFRALGPALYTNPVLGGDNGVGGPGISQANNPPPRARDAALFAECLFYSDLTYLSSLEITLLSTVAAVGLTAGNTLTIGGIVYTAIVPGAPANNQFVVATVAAGSSASEAIERTAQNLVEAINKSTTNTTTWAHYISNPDGLPGRIRLEARGITSAFTAATTATAASFRPSLATAVTANTDIFANGYTFSKPSQGDAVPAVNVGFIGRDDTAILRMQVLRDSLYLFTDAGVYRLTGRSFDDFSVQEFDLTFRLLGREMVTVCDDYIYAWGYEGIARISSAGLQYISNAIEPLLWSYLNSPGIAAFQSYGWAASFRSRHKILFGCPDSAAGNAGNCSQLLVYDTRMGAWTRWTFAAGADANRTTGHSCGAVRVSDDLLFLGQWNTTSVDSKVFKERRAFAAADYKDDTYDAADLAITKTVQWAACVGSPESSTHWDEIHLLYDISPLFSAWTTPTAVGLTFTADFASASSGVTVSPTALSRMSRATVAREQRRSARLGVTLTHSVASEYFGLEGMVLVHLPEEGTATVRT